jgi:hypothetical protein
MRDREAMVGRAASDGLFVRQRRLFQLSTLLLCALASAEGERDER